MYAEHCAAEEGTPPPPPPPPVYVFFFFFWGLDYWRCFRRALFLLASAAHNAVKTTPIPYPPFPRTAPVCSLHRAACGSQRKIFMPFRGRTRGRRSRAATAAQGTACGLCCRKWWWWWWCTRVFLYESVPDSLFRLVPVFGFGSGSVRFGSLRSGSLPCGAVR